MSVYKFDRMEWAIEKATELGVTAIAPVIARRTDKHLAQSATKRAERWRRIAHEAAQQARRSDVPVIADPVVLAERVRELSNSTRIVLAEQERTTTLRTALEEAIIEAGQEMPTSRSRSGLKADGLRKRKRCLMRTAGVRFLSALAFSAQRLRRLPRWLWWLRFLSRFWRGSTHRWDLSQIRPMSERHG